MNKINDVTDEKLKIYASLQRMVLPYEYEEMVEERIDYCIKRRQTMKFKMPKAVVAVLVLAVLLGATAGVYAAKNYLNERMENVSQEEKKEYVSEVLYSDANADVYSRNFTEEERRRIQELEKQYLNEGLFPTDSLLRITSEEEIDSSRICFMVETSTFYLPEENLTDEDILELIDFYYIRDYSLEENNTLIQREFEIESEMDHAEAVELAKEKVQSVFGIDTSNVTISTEYNRGNNGKEDFSDLYVTVITEEQVKYLVPVSLQTGRIGMISVEGSESNYASGMAVDVDFWLTQSEDAKRLAQNFNPDENYVNGELEYITKEEQTLDTGVVNYLFFTEDGKMCIVSYSCVTDGFYSIINYTKEGAETRNEWKEVGCEERGNVRNVITIND